jgi:acyl-CoA dehydrogenase
MYLPRTESDATGQLEAAFLATIACEPIDEKIRKAVKRGKMAPRPGVELGFVAKENSIISADEYAQWSRKEALRKGVIKVDDFPQDFGRAALVESAAKTTVKMKAA